MKQIFIGNNASGKTRKLLELYELSNKRNSFCNILASENVFYDTFKLNKEKLKICEDILDILDGFNINGTTININLPEENRELSPILLQYISYACLDIDSLFLDEPELMLSSYEQSVYSSVLCNVERFFKDLVITTHSLSFSRLNNDFEVVVF